MAVYEHHDQVTMLGMVQVQLKLCTPQWKTIYYVGLPCKRQSVNSVRAFCKSLQFISLCHVVKALFALFMGISRESVPPGFCVCVVAQCNLFQLTQCGAHFPRAIAGC